MFVRSISLGVVAAALMASGAHAADLMIPTTPAPMLAETSGFAWDGLYAGVQGGGDWFDDATRGTIGGVVGVNYIVADPILLGFEVDANYVFGDHLNGTEFLAVARLGAVLTDQVMVYADAGAGVLNAGGPVTKYQLGGGVEVAVADNVSIRGQVDGVGTFGSGFNEVKATVGAFYHF